MRIVVVGATGNVGTSLLRALAEEPAVESIVGVARRRPSVPAPKTEWIAADIVTADLTSLFRGADAVVHLAWLIQPGRRHDYLWQVNVEGSSRVFRAVADARVPALIYASSVGAYSPGPKDRAVDESWPTRGIASSFYARHKAEVESRLDRFMREHPGIRVVRLRPGLIFKREAATGIRRLFIGPLLPSPLIAPSRLPFVPDIPGLRFQAVHSLDVGDAYRLALLNEVHGAFNVAAEPVLDPEKLSEILGARRIRIAPRVARSAAALSFHLHLQPSEPGWLDLGLGVPIMDTTRARTELGWQPKRSAGDALRELLAGMAAGAGANTPPLDPESSGPFRMNEFLTGVGERDNAIDGKENDMGKIETPRELFVSNLRSTLKMENEIVKMLEELQEEAQDSELKQKLAQHHRETQQQVRNLERAFEALGEEAKEDSCPPIEGLEKDGKQGIKQVDESLVDHVILGSAAKTEHHEIAVYNGLIIKAEALGEDDVANLLRENLEQEEQTLKEVDEKARKLTQATAHGAAR